MSRESPGEPKRAPKGPAASRASTADGTRAGAPAATYRVALADVNAHLYRVTLEIPAPQADVVLSLPVWIPGSYMVREFARHLSGLQARQGRADREVEQVDKTTWRIACEGAAALVVTYLVYAFDVSVRTAYLDKRRGFFNGTGLFLRVHGRERMRHRVVLDKLPRDWDVATALPAAAGGAYEAPDYDELVDHPVMLGRFWRGSFDACGVPHEFCVEGAWPSFDGARLIADARRICETQIAFWHARSGGKAGKPPFARYVFMLNVFDEGYGGLEHRASTALVAARRDLPRRGMKEIPDGYAGLLGLVSHEYFHTWNVKRLKPQELAAIDYSRENHTSLLWFFEGFTSYYDDLLVLRSGLIDVPRYLKQLAKNVSGVLAAPGRFVQSAARASFDAWTKYYRPDENTPNATISYYAKGSLIALALDLTLRESGRGCLDDAMRRLWHKSSGGPIERADIERALRDVGGRGFEAELASWVDGTNDLPLRALLERAGVDWLVEPASLAQRLGIRVSESAVAGVQVKHVLRAGLGERGGLAAGDELIAANGWRLRRLDDALLVLPGDDDEAPIEFIVSRDQRVFKLGVPSAPPGGGAIALAPAKAPAKAALALRKEWLGG